MIQAGLAHLEDIRRELEWRRCAQDAEYFFENYVVTVDRASDEQLSKFHMTDYQREDLAAFESNREIIILKARQLGISTLVYSGYVLWKMVFKPGFNVLTTSKNQDAANNNNEKLVTAYRFLPDWMKAKFKVESETQSIFKIRHHATGKASKMVSLAATETVGASDTYNLAVLDEFGLSQYQEKTYNTIKPATRIAMSKQKTAAMIVLSTARGGHNMFAQMYRGAVRGQNQMYPIFHPWNASPWFTQEDYDLELQSYSANGKPWEIYSEYPASAEEAFRESGSPLFRELPPLEALEDFEHRGNVALVYDEDTDEMVPKFMYEENGPLRIKSLDFDPKGFYIIGADSSQGEQGDYQAALVMTIDDEKTDDDPEIVAYYHTNDVKAAEFAADLDRIGRFFAGRQHAALLAVEQQAGYGLALINELHSHLQYPNPYYYMAAGKRSKSRTAGTAHAFPMTRNVREQVLDRLRTYMANVNPNKHEVPVPRIMNLFPLLRYELGSFVRQLTPAGQVKYAADSGTNDDLVMALAISLWVLTESYTPPSAQEGTMDEDDTQWERFLAMRQRHLDRTAEPEYDDDLIYL